MNKKLTLAFLGALSLLINVSGFAAAAAAAGSRCGLRIIRTSEGLAVPLTNVQTSLYKVKMPDGTMGWRKISYPQGQTELMYCAANNNVSELGLILEHNPGIRANIDKYNSQGLTALMIAVISEHSDIVTTLLHHKADMELADTRGLTALGIAMSCRHISCINALLDAGAQRTRRDLEKPLLPLSVGVMNASVMRKVIDRLKPDQLRMQIPNALALVTHYQASEHKADFERIGLDAPMAGIKAELKQMIIALQVAQARLAKSDAAKAEVKAAPAIAAATAHTTLAAESAPSSSSLSPAAPTDVAMPAAAAAALGSPSSRAALSSLPVDWVEDFARRANEMLYNSEGSHYTRLGDDTMMLILLRMKIDKKRELEALLRHQAMLERRVKKEERAARKRLA